METSEPGFTTSPPAGAAVPHGLVGMADHEEVASRSASRDSRTAGGWVRRVTNSMSLDGDPCTTTPIRRRPRRPGRCGRVSGIRASPGREFPRRIRPQHPAPRSSAQRSWLPRTEAICRAPGGTRPRDRERARSRRGRLRRRSGPTPIDVRWAQASSRASGRRGYRRSVPASSRWLDLSVRRPAASSAERRVAASTASIRAPRTPPRSRACRPAMVVPPGLVTWSLSTPGCRPVSSTIRAAPRTVCAASIVAMSRGRPTRTPPSERASIIR